MTTLQLVSGKTNQSRVIDENFAALNDGKADKKPLTPNFIPGTDNMWRTIYFNAETNQIETGDPTP